MSDESSIERAPRDVAAARRRVWEKYWVRTVGTGGAVLTVVTSVLRRDGSVGNYLWDARRRAIVADHQEA